MENRKKIDDLFRNELGNYSETPPPAVWDALEKKLDNAPSKKPRSPYVWAGYLAMVCALVATVALVSRNISGNGSSNNVTATNTTHKQSSTPIKTSDNSTVPASTGNTQNNVATTQNNDSKLNHTENNTPKPSGDQTAAQNTTASIADNTKHKVTNNRTNDRLSDIGKTTIAKNERHAKAGSKKQQQNSYSSTTQLKHNNESAAGTNAGRKTEAQVQNEYNSAGTKTDNTEGQVQNEYNSTKTNTGDDPKPSQEVANTDKKDPLPGDNNSNTPPPPPPPLHKPKPKYTRFEAGIKGGYEFGSDNDAAKKAVIAPYLQYKISPKLAIMLQPAIKAASLNNKPFGDARSYYKINNDGAIVQHTDSTPIYILGMPDTLWRWDYRYTQTHDSIVKTYVTGGTYIEFEVPLLLKYYLTKDFSVYGGVNIVYSQQIGVKEQTYTSDPIQKTAYDVALGPAGSPAPAPPQTLGTEITYNGSPISGYTGPLYTSPQAGLLRFGYMFGFSYEYSKKWLFDALIQQGQAKQNIQGGYNTNTALSAPYIRLTVGYKLTK